MIDIYNRLPTDQAYKPGCETEDEIEMLLSQIKMVLGTNPGDVLGSPYFGVNIKKYIFNMSYNQHEINQFVKHGILSCIDYDPSKFDIDINVNFGKDHVSASDYAVLDITINQRKCLGIVVTQ